MRDFDGLVKSLKKDEKLSGERLPGLISDKDMVAVFFAKREEFRQDFNILPEIEAPEFALYLFRDGERGFFFGGRAFELNKMIVRRVV